MFSPQHLTPPVTINAHACEAPSLPSSKPAATAVTPTKGELSVALVCTSTGQVAFVVVPLPSWFVLLNPQHFTPPLIMSAHVDRPPDVMAATPVRMF